MRTRLLNLLLLAALVYSASLLLQFLREPPPALPPIASVSTPPAEDAFRAGPPGAAAELRPETYDVIVARDPFSPTRGVVPPAASSAAQPPAKALPPPKLTLYGVVIVDGEKSAFLQEGTKESRPRKVRENEAFAGGTVSAIRPDGVTFRFAGNEIVVPLRTPKDVPEVSRAESGAAGQQTKASPASPRRITQTGGVRAPMPPGATQNQMQPNVIRGMMPPGLAQGQIPAILTPAPNLSTFPPASGLDEGEEGAEEPFLGNAFDEGVEEAPPAEEESP